MSDERGVRVPDGLVSTALEVAGFVVVLTAAWLAGFLVGLAATGVLLVVAGVVLGQRSRW